MNKRILGTLFGVLFIVMLGFSVLFPVEPYYIRTFGATSRTMGWLMATYSLAQFLLSPLWGRLSDRIGRKPVMLVGLTGYAGAMALFGMAGSLPMLFVARGLAGVLSSATLPTAKAMIADTTTEDERAKGMGVLGAAFGLGVIFGPFIGGVLGDVFISLPFFFAAGLSFFTAILVWRILPETLTRKTQVSEVKTSRWDAVNSDTAALYLLALVVTLSLSGLEASFPFLANDRLGLTQRSVGYVYAVMGVAGVIVQGGLVGWLKQRLGEVKMIPVGLALSALGMAGIAVAGSAVAAAAAISLFAAGHGLIRPANTSLVSQRAKVGHGLAIGLLDSMDSLGRVLGPVIGGTLYTIRTDLPFTLGAVLNLGALLGFLLLISHALRSRKLNSGESQA